MKRLDRRLPLALLVLALGACDAILGIPERSLGPRFDCSDGECDCKPGWGNCDGHDDNGCEVSLESELNCGRCGKRCENSTCVNGECACIEGYGDCDGRDDNGCETDLWSDLACGGCGQRCDNGRCLVGLCSCLPGHADCDGLATNGCEATFDSDAANCGVCGHRCEGGACEGGRCAPVVVVNSTFIGEMTLVDSTIYYLAPEGIMKVPKTGGTPAKLCDPRDPSSMVPFAISGGAAYWGDKGQVSVCPLDGSAQKVLGKVSKPDNAIGLVLVGGGWVYWVEIPSLPPPPAAVVFRARADGTTATPAKVFTFNAPPQSFYVDDTGFYWVDEANKLTLLKHDLSGPLVIASDMPFNPRLVKREGTEFYVSAQDGYYRWSITDGPRQLFAPPSFCQSYWGGCEAFDQSSLYFFTDHSIERAPLIGGEVAVLLDTKSVPPGFAIAVDEQFVYFANYTSIRRIQK